MNQKKTIKRRSIVIMGEWCFAFTLDKLPEDNKGIFSSWNKKFPLKWQVLKVENSKAFVVCKEILCNRKFDTDDKYNVWNDTDLRNWLNTIFIERAFNDEEKEKILTTSIITELDREGETILSDETQDKIFILSTRELWNYLPKNSIDCDVPYWLRDRSDDFMSSYFPVYSMECLNIHKEPHISTERAPTENLGIRPAMWIDISERSEYPK